MLKSRLALAKAEKELKHRKVLYYKVHVAIALASNQCLQNQIQSNSKVINNLQSALNSARDSAEATLAHERTAANQNVKMQKSNAFHSGFEEGSCP